MKKQTYFLAFVVSIILISGCGGSNSNNNIHNDKQLSGKLLPPEGDQVYFGAFTNFTSTEDEVSEYKITNFDELSGKPIAWSYFSNNWMYNDADGNHKPEIRYPRENIQTILNTGKTPFVRLLPWTSPHILIGDISKEVRESAAKDISSVCHSGADVPYHHPVSVLVTPQEKAEHLAHGDDEGLCFNDFSMQSIIDGNWDDDLREWANEAKNHLDDNGNPIRLLMTFTIEMNGYWFPWSGINNGGVENEYKPEDGLADGPERFRDAYRHIIDLFREEEATNITWFFVPDTVDADYEYVSFIKDKWNNPANYYPGDDYIDWIGINLYGVTDYRWKWSIFSKEIEKKYKTIEEISDTKPLALLEFGVTEDHKTGNKSEWLNDAFTSILSGYPLKFQAISYWNDTFINGNEETADLTINSSEETLTTFRQIISNPRFISELHFSP